MTQNESSKKLYEKRKSEGLCIRCGNERTSISKTYCKECLIKKRTYEREARAFFKNIGICPICRKNKLFGDEKSCLECRAKRIQKKNITEEYLESRRKKQREKHRYCVENGICTRCHKRKAVYNRKKCEICLEYDRVKQALRRN